MKVVCPRLYGTGKEDSFKRFIAFSKIENKIGEGTFHQSSDIVEASNIDLAREYSASKLFNILRGCSGFSHNWAYFDDCGKTYEVSVVIREKK